MVGCMARNPTIDTFPRAQDTVPVYQVPVYRQTTYTTTWVLCTYHRITLPSQSEDALIAHLCITLWISQPCLSGNTSSLCQVEKLCFDQPSQPTNYSGGVLGQLH